MMAVPLVRRIEFLGDFNWRFLIWTCGFGIAAVLFLFYFNRLISFALFGAIRAYTWLFYKIHIRCQAIQFSLLGGRIFLRGLEYRAENETIVVHQAYITWRYWYRKVAEVDLRPGKFHNDGRPASDTSGKETSDSQNASGNTDQEAAQTSTYSQAPCRISVHIRGIEWFVYNRSPSFDAILASAARQSGQDPETAFEKQSNHTQEYHKKHYGSSIHTEEARESLRSAASMARPPYQAFIEKPQAEIPFFLRVLPIYVECTKAAMVMGNHHTRSILVAKIDRAEGRITAGASGFYDKYRQHFCFKFFKPVMRFCPNEDYIENLLTAGARINGLEPVDKAEDNVQDQKHHPKRSRHRARHALAKLMPRFARSVESFRSGSIQRDNNATTFLGGGLPGEATWLGLTRYLDEDQEDRLEHERWRRVEYAEEQVIADCPSMSMDFYWDVPGSVPYGRAEDHEGRTTRKSCELNGSEPPVWGLELHIGGGNVNYGPWADRQRIDLMLMFFPSTYANAMPALPLGPGQTRISTVFNISIVLDDKVTLRLHSREPSKDWKIKGKGKPDLEGSHSKDKGRHLRTKKQKQTSRDPNERPAGWLDVTFEANTAVAYDMDMMAKRSGFTNKLRVDVVSPVITSSVNADVFLRAKSMTVVCDLSNPLSWNAKRTWKFDISSRELDLFMLREHAFLVQDLVEDFTSGPAAEFYTFIPFHYAIGLVFDNFRIYLNANDLNIIDKPADLGDNSFLILGSKRVIADVGIPADLLNPVKNRISFNGALTDTSFQVSTPTWNTYNTLLQDHDLGNFPTITAEGSYNYFSSTSPALTDTLLMQIHGDQPKLRLYGFLIRLFMTFRENYFGEDVHFQTIEEYQARLNRPGRKHAGDNDHKPIKQSNDLDVILSITTTHPCVVLPSKMYSSEDSVKLDMEFGNADLRFTNYYMDLQTTLSPMSLSHPIPNEGMHENAHDTGVQTFIDGLTITGHRLFGLPPMEPTYVCNWDFDIGAVTGEASIEYLGALVAGVQCLMYGLDDAENALPLQETAPLNDVTFIRAYTQPIKLWLRVDQMAMLCDIDSSRIEFNDWARHRFSEKLHVVIPRIVLAAVDGQVASRRRRDRMDGQERALTYGYIQTSVDIRMVSSKANFRETRQRQQEHIRLHDSRTSRTPWLLSETESLTFSQFQPQVAKMQPPASTFPPMPGPFQPIDSENSPQMSIPESSHSKPPSVLARGPHSFVLNTHQRGGHHAQESSAVTTSNSEKLFSQNPASSSRSSLASATDLKGRPMAPGTLAMKVTFSSSYEQPYFPLLRASPDDDDLPEVIASEGFSDDEILGEVRADDMPLEDDEMEHMTLMVALETGLRVVCTPPALKGLNTLVATLQNRDPDSLLDDLQMRSLGDVMSKKKQQRAPKITQLRLRLPGVALRFRHHVPKQLKKDEKQQTYEFALSNLLAIARSGAERGEPFGKTPSSMQISIKKVELEACRTSFDNIDDARVLLKLNDISSWLYEAEETTGNLQFRTLETASLNQKFVHLAALVNSAGTLASSLGSEFASTIFAQSARLQLLVHRISGQYQNVSDPAILSSAAFVSRRWEEVVRTSDSWKMMMRLRWIYKNMGSAPAARLRKSLGKDDFNLPHDALSQIIDNFMHWRSWDLEHIRASSLMHILYGSSMPAHQDKTRKRAKPVRLSFGSEIISLIIDPGKRRNKVVIRGLAARLQSDLKMSGPDPETGAADHLVRKSAIEVSCERLLLEAKLEILDAVRDIFTHVKKIKSVQPIPQPSPNVAADADFVEQQLHLVVAVDRNDVRIRSKHIKISVETLNFGSSIAAVMSSKDQLLATALLTARLSTVKVRAASREMIRFSARGSSVYGNLSQSQSSPGVLQKWKIGAQCQWIELDVLDSALGLLGVADQVIGHEVIYLQRLSQDMVTAIEAYPDSKNKASLTRNVAQITFLLDSYCITTVLFSSLRYRLEGKQARSSLLADPDKSAIHTWDFDVNGHAHSVFNNEKGEIFEVSRLALPPINGRVTLKQADQSIISVAVEISKIALDASAVHGLFTTLSRTELMRFGENVMRDVEVVQSNYQVATSGVPSPTSPRSPDDLPNAHTPSKSIAYVASIGVAGVAVLATSSNSLKTSAELIVDSGPIHFGIRNSHPTTGALLPFPELDLRLHEIGVLLERLQNGQRDRCGSITLSVSVLGTSEVSDSHQVVRAYRAVVEALDVDIFTETASMIIDILGYLQQRFKSFNLSEELHTFRARRRRRAKSHAKVGELTSIPDDSDEDLPVALFDAIFTFQMRKVQAIWHVGEGQLRSPIEKPENLVFSVRNIDLHTKKGNTARLEIKDLQLQMVPISQPPMERSKNSALLPEVIFKVAYMSRSKDRRLALQAIGKALDLRLTSQFILPAVNIQRSITVATQDLRKVLSDWNATLIQGDSQQKSVLGDKRLSSLVVDADFAGAVVHMEGRDITDPGRKFVGNRGVRAPREGKYGQFTQANSRSTTTLRSPGLAFRVEYSDTANTERHLNGELKVAASSNELQPMFVPLVLEVMASVKDIVGDTSQGKSDQTSAKPTLDMSAFSDTTNATTILGDCKLNLGLRICQQSFSLTCKPIAQVTATARFQDIYITVSTVQPANQERFFSVSSAVSGFETAVQHVYSRESTGRFQVDTIHLSLMNSKHFSGMTGISSILNISPMKVFLNVKQLQDFLLFREIWYPLEIRPAPQAPTSRSQSPVKGGVQRYQQATATNAFSWNAAIHIAALELSLDLGQAVGKPSFSVNRLWITSRKDSEREQNLCLGFDSVGMESTGRMSGSIQLRNMRVRTNIVWPETEDTAQTPLVQASLGFDDLRAKTSFDYQTFFVADFQTLSFLLYNVTEFQGDRLVCTVNGDKIQAFCTANAAAQAVALYQAINRLIEEKQAAFQTSLKEMEKFQRQKAAAGLGISSSQELSRSITEQAEIELTPVRLQVNVVVSLNALRAGVYPRAFRDAQIFKLEALDALARFSVNAAEDDKVHTLLTVVLGQLRVALSTVERNSLRPKPMGDDVSIENVVKDSTASRGGTILKVPRVVATMQTWQVQASKNVEYIFKSSFEGKVEVGWNYSRVATIQSLWQYHSQTLVQRLGKLPPSAVQITSSPRPDIDRSTSSEEAQEKITAVVNVPASKYTYEARVPPIISTPQLRDMGEATPPMEWIGLKRERLPHLTHQVVIVPLLGFSKEVEDAYGKILGAS